MSSSVRVCTVDLFALRAEGKALGFDLVVMDLDEVSLFSVPQTSQVKMASVLPKVLLSRRFPQAVQNTSEPIAAISGTYDSCTALSTM